MFETAFLAEWGLDRWLAILGIILVFVSPVLITRVREWVARNARVYWFEGASALAASCVLTLSYLRFGSKGLVFALIGCFFVFAFWVAQRFRNWKPYAKISRGRWNKIREIRYGHLEYEPFLFYRRYDKKPSGIGVELLSRLLSFPVESGQISMKDIWPPRNWSNVLDGLVKDDYDIVATPLFATFDRSRYAAFTAPLCFSNVGLYVTKEAYELTALKDVTMDGLKDAIQMAGVLSFLSVKGEISEKLAKKYAKGESITPRVGRVNLSDLFTEIGSSRSPYYALFCESFYADDLELVKSKRIVNVLPRHGILYPVCFAVRQGDYQLINLLNIRLLQFNQNGGALPLLAQGWRESKGHELGIDGIKEHFVAEWPCQCVPMPLGDPTHA